MRLRLVSGLLREEYRKADWLATQKEPVASIFKFVEESSCETLVIHTRLRDFITQKMLPKSSIP
jgi:hypothetical protein